MSEHQTRQLGKTARLTLALNSFVHRSELSPLQQSTAVARLLGRVDRARRMPPVHELIKPMAAAVMPGSDSLRGKHTVVGLLICILSSWPLSQLSRKVASMLTVLLTALLAILQRARERTPLTEHGETMCLETFDGDRHEVCASHRLLRPHVPCVQPRPACARASALLCAAVGSMGARLTDAQQPR